MITFLFISLSICESYFFESFDDDTLGKQWIPTKSAYYNGSWSIEERKHEVYEIGSKGLVMTSPNSYHAITHRLNSVVNRPAFVLQYELKFQDSSSQSSDFTIKLFGEEFDDLLSPHSPFLLSFGLEIKKNKKFLNFSIATQNPKTHKWTIHNLTEPPPLPSFDNLTHLYTLILTEDERFMILFDYRLLTQGTLLSPPPLFTPSLLPSRTLIDEEDNKPDYWVDEEYIIDPLDIKPPDWNEEEPLFIPDPYKGIPKGWMEEKLFFEGAREGSREFKIPKDWNEEKDGKWEIPLVENKDCLTRGCGIFSPPSVPNPRYRGKYERRKIKNPDYIGEWTPRMIKNRNFYEPKEINRLGRIRGIGIEGKSERGGIIVNNIYIGDSEDEGREIGNEFWLPRYKVEYADYKHESIKIRDVDRKERIKKLFGIKNKEEKEREERERREKERKEREAKEKERKERELQEQLKAQQKEQEAKEEEEEEEEEEKEKLNLLSEEEREKYLQTRSEQKRNQQKEEEEKEKREKEEKEREERKRKEEEIEEDEEEEEERIPLLQKLNILFIIITEYFYDHRLSFYFIIGFIYLFLFILIIRLILLIKGYSSSSSSSQKKNISSKGVDKKKELEREKDYERKKKEEDLSTTSKRNKKTISNNDSKILNSRSKEEDNIKKRK